MQDELEFDEDYEIQENEDGSADVIPVQKESPKESEFYSNVAEEFKDQLDELVVDMLANIELDRDARKKRDKQYAEAIQRSGLGDDAPGGAEFEGASRVVHPMIAESAIDFASAAIKELFPCEGAVKTRIEGKVTPKKLQKADRKARHMNWQLRKQIKEFRPSLEQILSQVPMGGVQYSKMYYCSLSRRPKFEFVPLDDIYVPFNAADFYSATRKTHAQKLGKIEFQNRISAGMYLDPEEEIYLDDDFEESKSQKANDKIEGKESENYDEDGRRLVYEVYCFLEIEDPKKEVAYAPYIWTIDEATGKTLSLYRNWDSESETYESLDWITEWQFIPWRGAYSIGLPHLIGGLSAAATGSLRALLDSSHINNAPTAIKLKGAQFSGQSANISVTQIHEIDAAPGVDDIRKIAMPLPFNPPSQVLFQLLGFLIDAAKGIVKTSIENSPDYSPNTPPGTYLAQIEQGMKVYSAIHARLHCSLEKNLEILHRLNKEYLEQESPPETNDVHDEDLNDGIANKLAYRSDYDGEMDVQPVSDPNIFSESQRYAQMQSVGQLIAQAPQLYDIEAYHRGMLQLMKVPNYEQFLIPKQSTKDENPITENIKLATGVPCGVLPDQDHLAHIQSHLDFYMSPALGQSPAIKPQLTSAMLNHIIQHLLMQYGEEVKTLIEQTSGREIKDLVSDNEEVMLALSKAAAAASPLAIKSVESISEKVLPIIQEMMQYVQTMSPQQPIDPSQAQMQAVQIQAQTEKMKTDAMLQTKQLEIQSRKEEKMIDVQKDVESSKIAQFKMQQEFELEKFKLQQQRELEILKSQTELEKNQQDNITAWKISNLRAATTGNVGGLSTGASIGEFSDGGLVTEQQTNGE